jgi:hypothetical protein
MKSGRGRTGNRMRLTDRLSGRAAVQGPGWRSRQEQSGVCGDRSESERVERGIGIVDSADGGGSIRNQ